MPTTINTSEITINVTTTQISNVFTKLAVTLIPDSTNTQLKWIKPYIGVINQSGMLIRVTRIEFLMSGSTTHSATANTYISNNDKRTFVFGGAYAIGPEGSLFTITQSSSSTYKIYQARATVTNDAGNTITLSSNVVDISGITLPSTKTTYGDTSILAYPIITL